MQIVFFGTPYYVVPILQALHNSFKIRGESSVVGVVTQPPKPTGRKQIMEYSEIDNWAHKHSLAGKSGRTKIPVFFDSMKLIKEGINADVGILASYGAKIPSEVINYFPKGILVIHPSILPEFRWASPVPAMIVTNTPNIGATILKMDDKWDHGPIVAQFTDELKNDDNYQTLRDRLFERSAEVLVQALPAYLNDKIKLKNQDDSKASFARMITKEDAFIPPQILKLALQGDALPTWNIDFIKTNGVPYVLHPTPYNLHLFIKAMSPAPGAWTVVHTSSLSQEKRLKIINAHVSESKLVLDEVQLEGRTVVTWEQFKSGYPEFTLR